jgi:hypothetical protein
MTVRRQIEEHLLDLAWGQWTELGVAGTRRQHQSRAIVPEELLLLTSVLSPLDPRLRDESIDWCCQYHGYVSTSRLRSLFAEARDELKTAFSPYATTVNALAPTRWPTLDGAAPWKVKPRGRSVLGALERPALLHLRLRAIFGTGARADVIAAFLGSSAPDLSVAEVADIGYTKRNIANVLDDLAAGGLLRASKVRNQLRYQWARREALQTLVEPLPRQIPKWQPIMELVLALYWLVERTEAMPQVVRGVEAANQLPSIQRPLASLRWSPPDLGQNPEKAWDKLAQWAIKVVRTLASGSAEVP